MQPLIDLLTPLWAAANPAWRYVPVVDNVSADSLSSDHTWSMGDARFLAFVGLHSTGTLTKYEVPVYWFVNANPHTSDAALLVEINTRLRQLVYLDLAATTILLLSPGPANIVRSDRSATEPTLLTTAGGIRLRSNIEVLLEETAPA